MRLSHASFISSGIDPPTKGRDDRRSARTARQGRRGVAAAVVRRIREELARRDAGDLKASNPASVDTEFDEAIQVLLGEADTLPDQILGWMKGLLSDSPPIFADADARDWLRRDDVRALLKRSALALVAGASLDAEIEGSAAAYAVSSDDGAWLGDPWVP